MAWRGVHISQPARLNFRDNQLIVAQDDGEVSLAIEDVAWLILDTPQVSVTGTLLSALAEAGVAMIVPDGRHHPAGVLLSFHQHHAQAHIAQTQINISQPLKKRLWQNLVVAKIRNQAGLLSQLEGRYAEALFSMAERVHSGDPDNLEAQAARIYWSDLFTDFTRGNETDRRNALLNYGYAVVRAAIARACVASGLLPAFGVHHASRTNAFNLIDDLIEPFRPFVDKMARERVPEGDRDEMTVEDRRFMSGVLTKTAVIGKEKMTILAATEHVAMAMVRAMEFNSAALLQVPQWAMKAR
ncbi:type II CRISPR-associated endonuclease Cas1 [Candidatus Kirkpatrickella diaphorinae]|uniref:CRISPR-associated endonuclease Cas1 n=1 Tax=Candidatus Kirkpatrickella diaphorinae TaxID=2984322 RepID=A0ABY6GJC6_9PROT|nr:type II CRISPR-associated endonuclease Cas1 [Candidatus Kirkpatrickella diaphorinae]UYH51633.1 type II CRISPR-associated endonuclease Cas1 [Candidatus Kirkpatrickella diaphorinae]